MLADSINYGINNMTENSQGHMKHQNQMDLYKKQHFPLFDSKSAPFIEPNPYAENRFSNKKVNNLIIYNTESHQQFTNSYSAAFASRGNHYSYNRANSMICW